ncbi:MAG: dihydrolipoyl dehydrogenase [Bacteroidetes bacterium GWF2_41_61]|jgi:dihydrolipoamide dehydrogenase|nr:MAG: dihydrolipoyl dehydrogenase [Bacteroidetes bacterium GWF2_41_61]OFY88234.1 MAG: dihydrolipoyl dehydrogenase [Bacteroidetes bacterium RIFOXYA12_FULL_40_10]PKP06495.1 MAG: dihydrolipoyl dehydrogenase [Bacteroidetes bacterium HGW-Bacteroidetes-5]
MYDLIVIGSGPGGYVAAIRASQLGLNTVVIEKSELGGVCLNWGCIPTKALLKSVQALHYAQNHNDYGFDIVGEIKPDLNKIVERSRNVANGMSRGIDFLFKKNKVSVLNGTGKILSPNKVEVISNDGSVTVVEAKNIIIATGARANSLPFAPIDGNKIISYRQAMVPETLPKSLAVIGSGAIGSEFAYFYRSLGVEVFLIEYLSNIVPLEDDEVSAQLSRSFRKMGIKVLTSAQVKGVDVSGEMCVITVETKKGEEKIEVERVLSAVGVVANIENIGLEENGVITERGKIKVDSYYATNVKGIYAIGDVLATPALAHIASAEAICCVEKIAGIDVKPLDYTNFPGCTYTSPEIASTGLTERAVKESGIAYKIGKFPFTASGKASAAGERDGFVKLIIDSGSDKILGAHLIGANVTEMLSGIVVARGLGATAKDIMHSIHPHPTMSEAIMEAAAAAHDEVIHI